jgi:hypothetical protein
MALSSGTYRFLDELLNGAAARAARAARGPTKAAPLRQAA